MSYYHLCCKGNHDRAPEKIRNIMLDEPSICDEVLRLWNIYYHFSWLNSTRKHLVLIPDGEMKTLIMPVMDLPLFQQVIETFSQNNPLISQGRPLTYSYFPQAQIVRLKDSLPLGYVWMPFVRLSCFLKHLMPLIRILVEKGLIMNSIEKWGRLFRTNIHDPSEAEGIIIYTGEPEKWYSHFRIYFWEEQK